MSSFSVRRTTDTMRRLRSLKSGCKMRVTRRLMGGSNAWDRHDDVDWQRGLACEVRRVAK
jgi:hypothetical protein